MSARSRPRSFDPVIEAEKPSRCLKFLRLSWKFSRCVFSHVTLVSLVVGYCVIGAYAFEALEATHEKEVKRSIKEIRGNVTEKLWRITNEADLLVQKDWTDRALSELKGFESNLLRMMTKEGWDGSEEETNIRWTFAGALFYSIIVITTIGYGHIAPKTKSGKVVTIFYAILGIPLMLLCLSNIGDVMASSFRFLYWKVCCYACTKPPKRRRVRSVMGRSYSVRQSGRYGGSASGFGSVSTSTGRTALRRSIRASERSADSAVALSESIIRSSASDSERRFNARRLEGTDRRKNSLYVASPGQITRNIETPKAATMPRRSELPAAKSPKASSKMTTRSLDRRFLATTNDTDRSPVLCNRYALEDPEEEPAWKPPSIRSAFRSEKSEQTEEPDKRQSEETTERRLSSGETTQGDTSYANRGLPRRCLSVESATPNYGSGLSAGFRPASVCLEMNGSRKFRSVKGSSRRSRTNYPVARSYKREPPSPRIMSPMGFAVHRQVYADDYEFDYEHFGADDQDRQPIKPVPIWLCVFLVVSYIFGGAYLFSKWEKWHFLDSAYFCFITLTTIGFGDFVPAYKLDAHNGIALCSLYLLFGIALLAMSFNLVQEEVINNVKSVAKRLGIVKESEDEDEEDEDADEEAVLEYDLYGKYECEDANELDLGLGIELRENHFRR